MILWIFEMHVAVSVQSDLSQTSIYVTDHVQTNQVVTTFRKFWSLDLSGLHARGDAKM